MPSILLVDDEPGVRSALGGVLRDEGYEVDAVDSGEACLERLGRQAYDVVVRDIWLPGIDGLATLARMRERQVESQVVMISGHGNIESAVRAIKMGAFDFVEKPLSLDKTVLVRTVVSYCSWTQRFDAMLGEASSRSSTDAGSSIARLGSSSSGSNARRRCASSDSMPSRT